MKQVHQKLEFCYSDSKDYSCTKSSYLPGGTMSIWWDSIGSYINTTNTKIDNLGRFHAISLEVNEKRVICITMYRIPVTPNNGKYSSIVQYNQMRKSVKLSEFYRREILSSITNYLAREKYNDLIIAGDFNEDIFLESRSL